MLLLAASIIMGFYVVSTVLGSLDEIISWLKRGIEAVKKAIKMIVLGTKIFIRKIGEAFKEIAKNYSQDANGKWHETIVTREISEEEVPIEFRQRAQGKSMETDVTDVLQLHVA